VQELNQLMLTDRPSLCPILASHCFHFCTAFGFMTLLQIPTIPIHNGPNVPTSSSGEDWFRCITLAALWVVRCSIFPRELSLQPI
jgi:hypothetical protein